MVHKYGKWIFLTAICFMLAVSGCAPKFVGPMPEGLQGDIDEARALFQKAGDMGAKDCAPQDYAHAQVWLDYADHEVGERHWQEVREAIDKVKASAREAIRKCTPPARPTPPPPPAPPEKVEQWSFGFATIYFDTRKADIPSDAVTVLDRMGMILRDNPDVKVEVAGHSDSMGSEKANMEMSLKRAKSVATYLIDHYGISPHRLKVVGYGETMPVADNSTREGRRMNRRVEFKQID